VKKATFALAGVGGLYLLGKSFQGAPARNLGQSDYKLSYFAGRGRAEVPRYLFAIAGVPYEDHRIAHTAPPDGDWAKLKPKTPYGGLPVLRVDGTDIAQTATIIRFLGNRFDLLGSNEIERAKIDALTEHLRDIHTARWEALLTKDEKKNDDFYNNKLPVFVAALEKNFEGSTYLVGNKLSVADVATWDIFSEKSQGFPLDKQPELQKALKGAPKVTALVKLLDKHPALNKWIESRPKSQW